MRDISRSYSPGSTRSTRSSQNSALSDEQLRDVTIEFRQRLEAGAIARRPAGRGLRRRPRKRPPPPGHAPLRRPTDGWHDPARRQHRRNGHRRRQDAGGHAAGLSERPVGQGRARRHGQRLPGPPRHGMDGPALHGPGHDRRQHPKRHGLGRAAAVVRLRHHLWHEQRVRLRLPARQHAPGGPRRRQLPQAPAAGPGPAELCHHRRSGQHPHRRGPHAADHRRPRARRRHPLCQGRPHCPPTAEGDALRGQGKGAHRPLDRRGRARRRKAGRRGKLLHLGQHGVAPPDRQLRSRPITSTSAT